MSLGPVLDGVPGVVERSGFRALRLQVMGEPVVQAATERGGRIRLSQTGGVRRWEGPIRSKDLETPSWNGKDSFYIFSKTSIRLPKISLSASTCKDWVLCQLGLSPCELDAFELTHPTREPGSGE